ncbi:hypothetical protein NUU61_004172 [Penicillium alfredii]|uniref:DUF4604 domain-containing protein n=1 Tax=Penicillium alfredii TaxID=1506179 RepID=A0A9W9FKP9_9EURO|nr:uncharacterized protein NUU61_004172 [Penicillium alfredii]KAJ5101950.1 hypothetical protein NUU61_004172 [Penicillium alfredii]
MSKNSKLAYEAKEPAFLQKLRGQYGNTTGRLERPVERPRKLKSRQDEEDDEPTYVDEESNEVISKEEYRALVGASDQKEREALENKSDGENPASSQTESTGTKQSNLTEVGGQRKRKQAKVVGEDKAEPEEPEEPPPKGPTSRKPKKQKKIKLSFDEE